MQENINIHIDYEFINWNKYINLERANKFLANKIKQEEKSFIVFNVKERYLGEYPIALTIKPHFSHKKSDLDNFRMKGLIDGLVAAGVIENDNLTKINKITLEPIFDGKTGVDVMICANKKEDKDVLKDFINNLSEEEKNELRKHIAEVEKDG